MRTELNDRNVGGDLYKAGYVLYEIKAANELFLEIFKIYRVQLQGKMVKLRKRPSINLF